MFIFTRNFLCISLLSLCLNNSVQCKKAGLDYMLGGIATPQLVNNVAQLSSEYSHNLIAFDNLSTPVTLILPPKPVVFQRCIIASTGNTSGVITFKGGTVNNTNTSVFFIAKIFPYIELLCCKAAGTSSQWFLVI